ncbi:MAG: 2-hydroxycarboxylate transporter family protein [Gammaproteobacteria bacterium]|nr:2-hydroxycarboxylate transporter family protein [Gammaproteobacteria bacterium]
MSEINIKAKIDEQNSSPLSSFIDLSKPFDIEGIPLKLYLLIAVLSVVVIKLGLLNQAGVSGAFAVLWAIGLFFYAVGERVRILKALVGGGLVVAWAGAAMFARYELIGQEEIQVIQAQIIGNGFLYFVLAGLVISSVLSVPTTVLKKSLVSYAPIIIGGLLVSVSSGIGVGFLVGIPMDEVVTRYFLPIMGGGAGAGALPMSEVYADVTGGNASEYFNHAIGVLTLGNLTAILIASLLVQLEKKIPVISGKGKLVKGTEQNLVSDEVIIEEEVNTHSAMLFIICILMTGIVLANFNSLHFFAWVTIIAVLLNLSRSVSPSMRESLKKLSGWGVTAFFVPILTAFGLTADFDVIIALFSLSNLLVIVSIVLGAALGAGITSHFVKLYPLEGAVTGGLCMADAGGSGDLQVLSAARRIELYPYSQLSSRIGGAFVLIIASYLFQFLA